MLRRKGIRIVSISEQADGFPTDRSMETIIERVDEFYSENLAQDVTRGDEGSRLTEPLPILFPLRGFSNGLEGLALRRKCRTCLPSS